MKRRLTLAPPSHHAPRWAWRHATAQSRRPQRHPPPAATPAPCCPSIMSLLRRHPSRQAPAPPASPSTRPAAWSTTAEVVRQQLQT